MKKRYVLRDEIKMRDEKPAHGQIIFFREVAHKSYGTGRFNAETNRVEHGDCQTDARYIAGWIPK